MSLTLDADGISHGIQLAVAPVFLLTAVAGMIGAVANRLARIIDRARLVEGRLQEAVSAQQDTTAFWSELKELRQRGHLANGSIALLTLCGFLIGATIVALFLGETTSLEIRHYAVFTFLSAVSCFMLALGCFLAETLIATRLLNFGKSRAAR